MFVYLCSLLTLLLALPALHLMRLAGRALHTGNTILLLAAIAFTGFIYLYGAWIFLSVYARDAFGLAALLSGVIGLFRNRHTDNRPPRHNRRNAALAAAFGLLDLLYYTGVSGHVHTVRLQFPMKGGRYAVLQGGKGLPTNAFHGLRNPAAYSMDLVKLDNRGRRCRYIFSKDLHDYYIFGDTVYAPCNGAVIRAVSGNPDNIPSHRERGPNNLNGVVIDGADCTVFLGHMQQGQVFVNAGSLVKAGQPIGLAGNSGMSIEPHLHIQAHIKANGDTRPWWKRPQLFMLFGGKEYLLNEVIDAR